MVNTNSYSNASAFPKLMTQESSLQMDPRLQRILARRQHGILQEATASSAPDEIAVVAKVTSQTNWEGLSEVRDPFIIGEYNKKDHSAIVTGRIPASRIEKVRRLKFVKSLKAAQPVQPTLAAGVQETNARPDLLPQQSLSNGGAGVVVGIVDYGCDFAHGNFRDQSGRSRLMSIWHQGGARNPGGTVRYGREYTPTEISAALTQPFPYDALGYGPAPDTPRSIGSHGTHVMDIAAGNGGGSKVAGFAPNADLVFVDVLHGDVPFTGPSVVESSFGDSVMLLEAIEHIFTRAGDRPCVVNISLGTNGGPHDGSTLVEEGIDRLVTAVPNRAVVISASNSFDDGIHASGHVTEGRTSDIVWRVPFNDQSHNEFELWYSADDRISLELIAPNGDSLGTIPPGSNGEVVAPDGRVEIFAANRLRDPNNGDNMIGIFLERTAPPGNWTIRLHGTSIASSGAYHAWIERDNVRPSSFAPPHDNSHTIGSISCGRQTIVVGSYDAHKDQRPISWFSSAGPTRDGREKPEISAPGHAVLAAHSRTKTEVVSKSGTSMAAPAIAGIVALMMGEARARGISLSIDEIRDALVKSGRSGPPAIDDWHAQYGFGRVNAAEAVKTVQDKAAGPIVTSATLGTEKRKAAGKKERRRRA